MLWKTALSCGKLFSKNFRKNFAHYPARIFLKIEFRTEKFSKTYTMKGVF